MFTQSYNQVTHIERIQAPLITGDVLFNYENVHCYCLRYKPLSKVSFTMTSIRLAWLFHFLIQQSFGSSHSEGKVKSSDQSSSNMMNCHINQRQK